MAEQLTKWSVTDGTVIRHMHYGLRVQIPSGEIGVVDRVDIADDYVNPADWPAIGSVITVVGAGYAGSQLRLSTRPSHLKEARARTASNGEASARAESEDLKGTQRIPVGQVHQMTRDDLAAMINAQTTACQPARAALLADGTFVVWDGVVPAEQLARTYRARLRRTQRRGHPTLALAATVDLLFQAAPEALRIGQIRPADKSWTFMIFLNADATAVLACTGVARSDPPAAPDTDAR